MGMTIDEVIKQLETYAYLSGFDRTAYDIAIDTMRKYQKIEEITQNTSITDGSNAYAIAFIDIKKVVEKWE